MAIITFIRKVTIQVLQQIKEAAVLTTIKHKVAIAVS